MGCVNTFVPSAFSYPSNSCSRVFEPPAFRVPAVLGVGLVSTSGWDERILTVDDINPALP